MEHDDGEPEPWVLEDDDELAIAVPTPVDDHDHDGTNLASTLTSDDVAGDDWADTTWLDELAPPPGPEDQLEAPARVPAADTQAPSAPRRPTFVNPPDEPRPRASARQDGATDVGASAARAPSAADEFAGLIDPISPDETVVDDEHEVAVGEDDTPQDDAATQRHRRPRPTSGGGQTAEFLRELSRLALDDD